MYRGYMQAKVNRVIAIVVSTLAITLFVFAQTNPLKQIQFLSKSQTTKENITIERQKLDANNISAWFRNDGEFYADHSAYGPGFEWPKGSGKYAIFSAGLWIGARYKDTDTTKSIRVATVGHFSSEYRPGMIDKVTGFPDDYKKPEYKIYKVRPELDNAYSNPDYLNWPIDQGAPWIDINNDGKWDPYVDKPGIIFHNGATFPDMMLFYVYNDADEAFHNHRYGWGGSKPLGVEIRKTVWAYSALPNVHFLRFQIYNKSLRPWDSTYIGLWSDPDVGYVYDDYAGCDIGLDSRGKRHDLGYCYNGDDDDSPFGYGDKPPAVGFKLMQGPRIGGGVSDSAIFFGQKCYGYLNQSMTSFTTFCNPGQGGCTSPDWFDPSNYNMAYKILQGYRYRYYEGGPTFTPDCDTTKFIFSGDPVTDTGCVNSRVMSPSDLRSIMCFGPFNLAPRDSQDVIFASLIEQGTDRLNSITKLRKTSSDLRDIYDKGLGKILGNVEFVTKYTSVDSTKIFIKAVSTEASIINARLRRSKDNYELNFQLFDDGLHNDGLLNDGIFGNNVIVPPNPELTTLSLTVNYKDGEVLTFESVKQITTSGPVKAVVFKIISDNINADGEANPGENIRCSFGLKNFARDTIGNFTVGIYSISNQLKTLPTEQKRYFWSNIGTGDTVFLNNNEYISFDVGPQAAAGLKTLIGFEISDGNLNVWYDTVALDIKKLMFPSKEVFSFLSAGEAEGNFGVRIVNPQTVKNNIYNITIQELDSLTKVFNLINTSSAELLLTRHPLPDELGHNIPVTEGFRITRGTTTTNKGLKNWKYTATSSDWFTGVIGQKMDLLKDKRGLVTYPRIGTYTSIQSGLCIDSLRYVEIRFDKNNTQKAYRYISGFHVRPARRIIHPEFRPFVWDSAGFGYLFQDFEKYRMGTIDSGYVVPFTVWEVDAKSDKIRQLDVGIAERNDTLYRWKKISPGDSVKEYIYKGNVDGRWNPSPQVKVDNIYYNHYDGDEIILIFLSQYGDTAKPQYSQRRTNMETMFPQLPLMYIVTMRRTCMEGDFNDGDVFKINPYYPLKQGDVYSFNPVELKEQIVPSNYRITQNYPNPFNAGTNIQYGLPYTGRVTLEIYNILGQRVATLINNEEQGEGNYTIYWDGTTMNGKLAASGVYLYRINVRGSQGSFAKTKKMIVIK